MSEEPFPILRRPRVSALRYALALIVVLAAYALQALIWESVPPSPALLFYPAVIFVAWWLGRRPAMIAIAVSCVGIAVSFVEPINSLHIPYIRDTIDLSIFVTASGIATLALDALRESLLSERAARKNAEAANLAKDEVLALVSHDLRNPLAGILINADLIASDPTAPSVHDDAARIRRLVREASELVEDILAFAKTDAGHLELRIASHSVREILERASETSAVAAESHGITLTLEATDALALCDRNRVLQVLGNLLANALKFTAPGGSITLRAERVASAIGIEVRDTGQGIPEGERDKIFDRYWTADRERGAGLGLHIARMLVQAQGGEIGVDSEVGTGSTFWFTLPAAGADVPEITRTSIDLRTERAVGTRGSLSARRRSEYSLRP